jgi:hypothetical protein
MARYKQNQHEEVRAAIQAAVDDGAETPSAVLEWLEDNGFEPMPTRPTVIAVLSEIGIEYVAGYWTRTK